MLLAVLIILGLIRRGAHPVVAPSAVSKAVRVSLPAPAGPPPVASRAPPDNAGGAEICGFGKVALDTTDPFAVSRYLGAATKKSAERWLSALLNSDGYRARAAGLLLEGKITNGFSMQPIAEQTRDALVQLAVGAADPAVYAMAMNACGVPLGNPASGACERISSRSWARMDPDNAMPWLMLAGEAQTKHNPAAEADAFRHAAEAPRSDPYTDSLYAFAQQELPVDVTPLERWYFATEVIGIEGGMRLNQYSVALRHCSLDAMQDPNVRQQCGALAELWVTQGSSLLDLGMGAAIGKRAGWPAQRVSRLNQERDALRQAIVPATPTGNDDMWSCNGVHLGNAYMEQRVGIGEVAAARALLERSGDSVQEMARKRAEYMQNVHRNILQREQESSVEPPP